MGKFFKPKMQIKYDISKLNVSKLLCECFSSKESNLKAIVEAPPGNVIGSINKSFVISLYDFILLMI